MRRLDELHHHLQWPFLGSRMLRDKLRLEGISVGRKHVATLMRKMGTEAIYGRANTSCKHPQNVANIRRTSCEVWTSLFRIRSGRST